MEDIMKLCDVVRETGFAIHRYHKHGHLEKVYENALAHRLRKLGLDVKQQYPLKAAIVISTGQPPSRIAAASRT